jgi:hypothetical protein
LRAAWSKYNADTSVAQDVQKEILAIAKAP